MSATGAVRSEQPPSTRTRVIISRPAEQAQAWVDALCERGIDAVAAPLIGISDAPDPAAVDAAWAGLSQCALLVFVSPNAVTRFFARRPQRCPWPDQLMAAVPGPGSSAALRALGLRDEQIIEPAVDAASFDSESLWERLEAGDWHGAKVLIVRGEGGRDWLASRLRDAGAQVSFVGAYRRGAAEMSPATRRVIAEALADPARHLWLLSSSEAIDNLMQSGLLPTEELKAALARSSALATHPRIAERARAAGFASVTESRPGIDDVAACIQSRATLDRSSASRSSQ